MTESRNPAQGLKMYILLHNDVPDGFAPNCAAHASLSCYKAFENDTIMQDWFNESFRKVTCRVPAKEFDKARLHGDCVLMTESDLDYMQVAIAFKPRYNWPKAFSFYRLWSPGKINHDGSRTVSKLEAVL